METQGTGSVREGSLEKVACDPSLGGGMPRLSAQPRLSGQRDGKEGIPGRRSHTEAGVAVGMCWV